MGVNNFTFKRGGGPRKRKPPKPEKTITAKAGIKVIPVTQEYRDRYENIKGFRKTGF
jgi:hypothetical protein